MKEDLPVMGTKILLVLVVLVAILAGIISTRPSEFHVTRSRAISAPASAVFAQVNDLHKWKAWSPWARLDPNATETHEGPAAGVGSIMRWSGNMKVGAGSMTIVDSRPNDLIRFRLDFLKPMAATNTAEFSFQPQGNQTLVTWTMSGNNNFIGKAVGLVMNCDKMIGGQFEQGLSQLAAVVEKS
jgi:uncharacterized protein YndB with AHSA1/START domain